MAAMLRYTVWAPELGLGAILPMQAGLQPVVVRYEGGGRTNDAQEKSSFEF